MNKQSVCGRKIYVEVAHSQRQSLGLTARVLCHRGCLYRLSELWPLGGVLQNMRCQVPHLWVAFVVSMVLDRHIVGPPARDFQRFWMNSRPVEDVNRMISRVTSYLQQTCAGIRLRRLGGPSRSDPARVATATAVSFAAACRWGPRSNITGPLPPCPILLHPSSFAPAARLMLQLRWAGARPSPAAGLGVCPRPTGCQLRPRPDRPDRQSRTQAAGGTARSPHSESVRSTSPSCRRALSAALAVQQGAQPRWSQAWRAGGVASREGGRVFGVGLA